MITSIHITKCPDYDAAILRAQLIEHLDRHPSFGDLTGKRVLLKVNLLRAANPERGVTTHPMLLKELILIVHERGGKAIIADSPGGPFLVPALKNAYKVCGYIDVAKGTGAELNYDTGSHEEVHRPGRIVKRFEVCDYLRNADMVIGVPKLKTHMLCGITCASKVMFGVVPGLEKVRLHTRFPDPIDFSRMVLDLTDLARADLYIVDGIEGMDGEGPSKGRVRKVGIMASGTEPAMIDLAMCDLTGMDPDRLNIMKAAYLEGLVRRDIALWVTGNAAGFRLDPPFQVPARTTILREPPNILKRIARRATTKRPCIDRKKCVGCGVCRDNCAGFAIRIRDEKAEIEMSKCIRCYCCLELCPYEAVRLKRSGISRDLLNRLLFDVFT